MGLTLRLGQGNRLGCSQPAQPILQALAKAAAQFEADLGVQHDLVLAAFLQLESPHPFEVDNDRAVDAEERASVQVLLEILDGPAHDVRGAAQVQARIVSRGFDPIDFRGL